MNRKEFEAVAREAVDGLPEPIRSRLGNIVFVIQDEPAPQQLEEYDGEELLGLFEGVPYPDEMSAASVFPCRITLFQGPIERCSADREEMIQNIRETVLHEVGHYLGLDDHDLEEYGL